MTTIGQKFLFIGGLGHTDLSGKVPPFGLLQLRQALRKTGHDAIIANYSTTLMDRLFPPAFVDQTRKIFNRAIKPIIIDGQKPYLHPLKFFSLLHGLSQLKEISKERANIERTVFAQLGQEISDQVKQAGFDAVGLSLYLGSSTIGAIIIADILRQNHPNLPILFGGPQTTHFSETIYQETISPTALVLGEGELAIVELANNLNALKAGQLSDLSKIPNIVFRNNNGEIVATPRKRLSLTEWAKLSAVPYEPGDFNGVMKYAFIETSRGCVFNCHFCPQPMLSGSERYIKPAKDIVDEMVELQAIEGISHFELVGSTTPPSQAEEIAQEIIDRGLEGKFSWVLFMRGKDERSKSLSSIELMEKVKRGGASAIFFGVEAADNPTLRRMGKGERIEAIEDMMLAAKNAGIATIGSFIYPYPGMDPKESDLIVNFLERVRPLSAPVQALGLYPGTIDSNKAAEIGCEIIYPDPADQAAFEKGLKEKPTMQSREVLSYLLRYPLILSLPMKFWPPLPYKIDGLTYRKYVAETSQLQRKISKLGMLLGFSHSHSLIAQVLKMSPAELSEKMFYCSLTGDPTATRELIERFNAGVRL